MPTSEIAALPSVWEWFRPCLSRPGYERMRVVAVGWILTTAPKRVTTEALIVTGIAGKRHHEAYHQFFSRGTWDIDFLGHQPLSHLHAAVRLRRLTAPFVPSLTRRSGRRCRRRCRAVVSGGRRGAARCGCGSRFVHLLALLRLLEHRLPANSYAGDGVVRRRARLGGLLSYYHREAA